MNHADFKICTQSQVKEAISLPNSPLFVLDYIGKFIEEEKKKDF